MTVYTGRNQKQTKRISYSRRGILNFTIIGLIVAAGAANLFVSNSVASQRYAVALEKKQLHVIGNTLAARETDGGSANMANLVSLANSAGMVPDKQGESLFLTTGVAFTNGSAQQN
ncbi:MAG: hypothetical protein AAB483_00025 [Patescibacteria group bacterium]